MIGLNKPVVHFALLVGFALPVAAQSGTIHYNQSNRLDFDVPPNSPFFDRLPKSREKAMVLTFTPIATLFVPAPDTGQQQGRGRFFGRGERMVIATETIRREGSGEVMMTRAMPFGMSGQQNNATESYTDIDAGQTTAVHEFLGREFRITEAHPSYPWKLTGEQATFLGYTVIQATAQQDSTTIEAWFTPDIPVSGGPGVYGGLPGMILTLAVDSNRVVYTATAVDTTTAVGTLAAPTDGDEVTRAEYEKIVKEKTEEMNRSRRGRRN